MQFYQQINNFDHVNVNQDAPKPTLLDKIKKIFKKQESPVLVVKEIYPFLKMNLLSNYSEMSLVQTSS